MNPLDWLWPRCVCCHKRIYLGRAKFVEREAGVVVRQLEPLHVRCLERLLAEPDPQSRT